MNLELGIKSDPVENRYSYEWLFDLCARTGITHVQLGGFYELPLLDDGFFQRLREKAQSRNVQISSVFTAHREVHGWFSGDPSMERAARLIYEKLLHAGALLGARYVGSSAGSVFRDRMQLKEHAVQTYLGHMKDLMRRAKDEGLEGLTIEPMSCCAEPPTFPDEIDRFMAELQSFHAANADSTVQAYILGDISHGYADRDGVVIHTNEELFVRSIPYMCEFHFKNTDRIFNSTFGFSGKECERGIVDLVKLKEVIGRHAGVFPVATVIGYLEHPGPKLGRDYTDYQLERMLTESIASLQAVFGEQRLLLLDTVRQKSAVVA
jgi:sugar phosphate isomerase/epimerase